MPLVGAGHSLNLVGDEAPYFTSLEELDSWMDKPSRKLRSVPPVHPTI
jgi:mannosyl-glycoprotein endo-beta-N-acetylglucosaminidase